MKEIKLKELDETIYEGICDNGLKVLVWPKENSESFFASITVRYGSIHSEFIVNNKNYKIPKGVAHFLEHILFNESDGTTAHTYYNKVGADTNAYTTFDHTNYQVWGSSNIEDNILHLLDFVQTPYFTKKMINDEKGIIIEESKMMEDNANHVAFHKLFKNIFKNSSYRDSIIGECDDIKKITIEDIKLIYDTFYHPENEYLIITGKINPYKIFELVNENQNNKKWKKFTKPKITSLREGKKVGKEYEEIFENIQCPKINVGIKLSLSNLKKYNSYKLKVMLQIILRANFGSSSDFKNDLINKEIINSLTYYVTYTEKYFIICFYITSLFKDEIIKRLKNKVQNLTLTEEEFLRTKKCFLSNLILEYDDIEEVNYIINNEILEYNKIIADEKEMLESITYNETLELLKILDLNNLSILVCLPNKKDFE